MAAVRELRLHALGIAIRDSRCAVELNIALPRWADGLHAVAARVELPSETEHHFADFAELGLEAGAHIARCNPIAFGPGGSHESSSPSPGS